MSLRLRLVLTVLLTTVPLVAGLTWLVRGLERDAAEEELRGIIVARMESGERERCEDSPETYGGYGFGREGRGRSRWSERNRSRDTNRRRSERRPPGSWRGRRSPLEVWAYDPSFRSANPGAPELPSNLQGALRSGELKASSWRPVERRERPTPAGEPEPPAPEPEGPQLERLELALQMPWDEGPCAVVLVRQLRPLAPSGPLGFHWSALVVGGVALLAVLLAAGPPVRRIRRLTGEVRRAAEGRYAHPVEVTGRDEIGRLAVAFNEASAEIRSQLERLEQRERALRSFLGNTTHDVMVPLTVLQGHLATLRRRLEASRPVDPDVLVAALNETQYIASLLHNLSAMAKLEGTDTEVRRDPIALGDLVERAVARHRPLAEARGIEINSAVPEDNVEIAGDVTLLEQALSNVIHNAVRYNETGGHVAVLLESKNGHFTLKVVDDGPGISANELERLPERRFRGEEARTRHPDGRGLGLHIARDVAARHGIELQLRASEYGGLEVEFSGAIGANGAPG